MKHATPAPPLVRDVTPPGPLPAEALARCVAALRIADEAAEKALAARETGARHGSGSLETTR